MIETKGVKRRNRKRSGKYYYEIKDPGHPLARSNGQLRLHRKLAYDHYGPGEHACCWCGKALMWTKTYTRSHSIVVDHLDENQHNNEIQNLAISCIGCNALRKRGWGRFRKVA